MKSYEQKTLTPTQWEYSKVVIEEEPRFTDGPCHVLITSADWTPEECAEEPSRANTYRIYIECVDDSPSSGAKYPLTYWLIGRDGKLNNNTASTLMSLGRAIFGDNFTGVPAPVDVEGCVVVADIKMRPSQNGQTYPKCYHFSAPTEEFATTYGKEGQHYRKVARL